MPVRIKKLNQKKKMPLPKSKPRHANPKHPMNTEKTKSMAGGGKLKMVEKGGKKVPFFAADGVGKMKKGGATKKKGMAKGGAMKKKGYAKGGAIKKMGGGSMRKKGMAKGGVVKRGMGGSMKKKGMAKGGVARGSGAARPQKFTRNG